MPRPRSDGTQASAARKRSLTELLIRRVAPERAAFAVWDTKERGLCLRVQPSGYRAFKFVYSRHGRSRWYRLGDINLSDARRIAAGLRARVANDEDPVAERAAERTHGTFGELATTYRERHAQKRNKSWRQAAALIDRCLMPRFGNLKASSISRADVRAMIDKINAPVLANQVLAAASAIFSWGMKQDLVLNNPCRGVERNRTKSRERVLSDSELPLFWQAFGNSTALKFILLTGQRPGEVAHMRREHIRDGWWEMPGEPMPALGWPGTKNKQSHRVWLPAPTHELIADDKTAGFVFAGSSDRAIGKLDVAMRAICSELGVERATPHDLRRTFSTTVTRLGFGRDALNRVTNHKEGGIASVYDRHGYADENKRVMEAVAEKLTRVIEAREPKANVVPLRA